MVERETPRTLEQPHNRGKICKLIFPSHGYCCYPFLSSGQTVLEEKWLGRGFLVLLVFLFFFLFSLFFFVSQMELSE